MTTPNRPENRQDKSEMRASSPASMRGEEATSNREQGSASADSSAATSNRGMKQQDAPKSIGALISQSLAQESQQGVERMLDEVREGVESAKEYVSENPKEALALAVCAGAAAWALLGTKPGRKIFEAGAAVAIPYATKWVSRNMAGVTH